MPAGGLRHLVHREHSDIDGVEAVQKTRKLKGAATASGRNAPKGSDYTNVPQFGPP